MAESTGTSRTSDPQRETAPTAPKRRELLGALAAASATAGVTGAALAGSNPDADLLKAWEDYRAAARGLRDCPLDDEEGEVVFEDAMDRTWDIITDTPARTPAGIAVKIRLAFALMNEGRDAYDHLFLDEPTDGYMLEDQRYRTLWGALEDVERLALA